MIANKLDNVHRRGDIAPGCKPCADKHTFAEFVPMSAKNAKDVDRLLGICEKYLPEQAWWYAELNITDDNQIAALVQEIKEVLEGVTAADLRKDMTLRHETASKADDLAKKIADFL